MATASWRWIASVMLAWWTVFTRAARIPEQTATGAPIPTLVRRLSMDPPVSSSSTFTSSSSSTGSSTSNTSAPAVPSRGSGRTLLPLAEDLLNRVARLSISNNTLSTRCDTECLSFSSAMYNVSSTTCTLNDAQVGDYLCNITSWAQECAVCVGGMDVVDSYDIFVMECAQEGLLVMSSTVDVMIGTAAPSTSVTGNTTTTTAVTSTQTTSTTLPPFGTILSEWDISPNNTAAAEFASLMSLTTQAATTVSAIMGNAALAAESASVSSSNTTDTDPSGQMDCPTLLAMNATALKNLNSTLNGTDPGALGRAIVVCDSQPNGTNASTTGFGANATGTATANGSAAANGSNATTTVAQTGTGTTESPDGAMRSSLILIGGGWIHLFLAMVIVHWCIGEFG